ncbi:MAG: site-2 protease family protein, partial [Planctomycetales bacterium]|nr:site-2 protease family protein [Planctomycetales bacterium]
MGLYLIATQSMWLDPQLWVSVFKAMFGLGFVIFVHELGHFLVAKMCGVKCEKFYVGFDVPIKIGPLKLPAALFRKQWGETEYGIGIIPLGGYVKMLGQDDNPANAEAEAERIRVTGDDGEPGELDPRSFPAKTVVQRMAIIAAGVTFNLIFAVVFATVAYRMGVSYTPCVVGQAIPGDPAWVHGLKPGERIVQIGKQGEPNEHLRFTQDLRAHMYLLNDNQDVDLLVESVDGKSRRWVTINPNSRVMERTSHRTIGISIPQSLVLVGPDSMPFETANKLVGNDGDRVTAVVVGGQRHEVSSNAQLMGLLSEYDDKDVELEVERKLDDSTNSGVNHETVNVTAPPQPWRRFGMIMELGPIVAIQQGSLAEEAGFKEGDRIVSYNDQPVGDPISLADRIANLAGQEIVFKVQREGSSGEVALRVTPGVPEVPPLLISGRVSLESIGVACELPAKVAKVIPNTPADRAEIEAGDQVVSVQFLAGDGDATIERLLRKSGDMDQPTKLDGKAYHWGWVFSSIQELPETVRIRVEMQKNNGQMAQHDLESIAWAGEFNQDDPTFNPNHNVQATLLTEVNTAASWGEALSLGA